MSAEDNIKKVQVAYEAFGRGDVPALLDAMADDVDWSAESTSTVAPWYGVRHGKQEAAAFFEAFGSTMEVDEFTPVTFAANDSDVLSVVHIRARARSTGRAIDMNLHHWFRFADGKICYYRGTEDSAQTEAALRG